MLIDVKPSDRDVLRFGRLVPNVQPHNYVGLSHLQIINFISALKVIFAFYILAFQNL